MANQSAQDPRIHTDTPAPFTVDPDLHRPEIRALFDRYWRTNMTVMSVLLGIWLATGLGGGVLFADYFNQFRLLGSGFPLGFWIAHQGSIMIFVLLILMYCLVMNRLDRKHHHQLDEIRRRGDTHS